MRRLYSGILAFAFISVSYAQRECGTNTYILRLLEGSPLLRGKMMEIIDPIARDRFKGKPINLASCLSTSDESIIVVPVVVHILYNEENQNISDDQIYSQLRVLNQDYNRWNPDSIFTPKEFEPFAAKCNIQFKLALKDADGLPTSGIIRKHTSVVAFGYDDAIKKSDSGGDEPWDTDYYLNIWVGNLQDGMLGFSSVPGCPKEVDGVVIHYRAFGNMGDLQSPYNQGRSTTHEVGHWLNLIHPWGDRNCGDDLVADTPPQFGPNRGCPSTGRVTCGTGNYGDMFMNFMDYTDDQCMNLFTLGQKARMRELFASGGIRQKLKERAFEKVGNIRDSQMDRGEGSTGGVIKLFPNPTGGELHLVLDGSIGMPAEALVMDIYGRVVYRFMIRASNETLCLQELASGCYYLKIISAKRNYVIKWIKGAS